MTKRILFFCAMASSVALMACNDVQINDGRIPAEYMDQARAVTGTYAGQSGGSNVNVTLYLNGDRLLAAASPDLIGSGCDSQIGLLRSVRAEQNNGSYSIERAVFDFAANNCQFNVDGTQVEMSLRSRNGRAELSTRVRAGTEWRRDCRIECTPMGGCREVCQNVPTTTYIDGRYTKIN